ERGVVDLRARLAELAAWVGLVVEGERAVRQRAETVAEVLIYRPSPNHALRGQRRARLINLRGADARVKLKAASRTLAHKTVYRDSNPRMIQHPLEHRRVAVFRDGLVFVGEDAGVL